MTNQQRPVTVASGYIQMSEQVNSGGFRDTSMTPCDMTHVQIFIVSIASTWLGRIVMFVPNEILALDFQATSPIGIDITILRLVCLSRSCIVLKRQKISTRFLLHTAATDWSIEHGFTSPPTQYRLYGWRFLKVKRPNQQYQSTEGTKYKNNRKWQ